MDLFEFVRPNVKERVLVRVEEINGSNFLHGSQPYGYPAESNV
ncbi:hypothetical protein CCACVL1_02683 [Corchorus capsularis]|uniref:Uncharacterized protein n=1 Tax=Corchorus capsularis TaxID=210143 RepID=A0A1R3K765_COCAP|nr:hypothetical protein CCACVL1_02683 [Corchorus capsularis]